MRPASYGLTDREALEAMRLVLDALLDGVDRAWISILHDEGGDYEDIKATLRGLVEIANVSKIEVLREHGSLG